MIEYNNIEYDVKPYSEFYRLSLITYSKFSNFDDEMLLSLANDIIPQDYKNYITEKLFQLNMDLIESIVNNQIVKFRHNVIEYIQKTINVEEFLDKFKSLVSIKSSQIINKQNYVKTSNTIELITFFNKNEFDNFKQDILDSNQVLNLDKKHSIEQISIAFDEVVNSFKGITFFKSDNIFIFIPTLNLRMLIDKENILKNEKILGENICIEIMKFVLRQFQSGVLPKKIKTFDSIVEEYNKSITDYYNITHKMYEFPG